jgi:tetratricopeptide (TPR) repeat protein
MAIQMERSVTSSDSALPAAGTAPELEPGRTLPEIRARFVARSEQLQELKRLFLEAREKRSLNVVTLVGDPGVGKTRLALEFARSVRAAVPDARVLSSMSSQNPDASFAPLIRVLAERFGIAENELARDARAKIEAGVAEVMPERLRMEVSHLIAHMMRFPFPSSPILEPLAQVPGQLEVRRYIAVRRFLEKDSERASLLLYFDGVERTGAETVNLIHFLAEGLRNCPVFILATARPTLFRKHQQWGQGEFAHARIEVGPLAPEESLALFTELVHNDRLPEELALVARDRLGGIARSLEELARYLVEVGAVVPAEGRWKVASDRLATINIPRSHEEILRARLRALSAEQRAALERAAVVGEVFWLDAVLALVRAEMAEGGDPDGPTLHDIGTAGERSRLRLVSDLRELCERGLIVESPGGAAGEQEFRFAYPPLWVLAYEMIAEAHRRPYHRLLAREGELRPEGRMEEQQEQAGRHLQRAGEGVAAAARYRRAADAARSRYFNDRAIRLYLRALACVGDADLAARIHIWHDLGSVYQLKGDFDAALDAFERMLRLSWVVAARAKGAVAFNKLGRLWRQKGNLDLALEYLERGLELFRQCGDKRGIATSLDDIGQLLWMLGRYEEALDRSAKALEMRREIGDKRSIAVSLSNIGNIEKDRGLFDEAESCYREAMQLRRQVGDRSGYVISHNNLGALAFERGDLQQARDAWEDALVEAEQIGALPLQMILLNNIGEAALHMGKLADARMRIERAMALAADMEDQRGRAEILRNLALLELKEGNAEDARRYGQECLELARRIHLREMVGRALMALGEIHAATLFDESAQPTGGQPRGEPAGPGNGRRAEDCFRKAVKVFREMRNEAELAKALKRLGEYLVEHGRPRDGRETLEEAVTIFERLGMRTAEEVRRVVAELGTDSG